MFNSGHNVTKVFIPLLHFTKGGFDVEFATESGSAVVVEEWGMPKSAEQRKSGLPTSEDELILKLHKELRPKILAPLQLANVDIEQYVGLFLPGGHGAMVNLPDSVNLGKLLVKAYEMELMLWSSGFAECREGGGRRVSLQAIAQSRLATRLTGLAPALATCLARCRVSSKSR